MDERYHIPVLLDEVISFLNVGKNKKYIDATLGGGGYTTQIAQLGGDVLGIDIDREAIEFVQERIKNYELRIKKKIRLVRGNFREIDEIAHSQNFIPVSAVVFDLGVSSHQLEEEKRGFSFQKEGPLDMRMGQNLTVTASDLVNALSEKELTVLLQKFGEVENASQVARAIVAFRKTTKITTTDQLADIVRNVSKKKLAEKVHPATTVFQALRIAVNDELGNLEEGLVRAFSLLDNGGRIVVVSFHSLEDRIVKNTFKQFEQQGKGIILTHDPIRPSAQEVQDNNRARSAKLRAFKKHE